MSRSSPHIRSAPGKKLRSKPAISLPIRREVGLVDLTRERIGLNQDWGFCRGEERGNWEGVNLPHSVRLEPLNASGCRNYQGVCWYRKQLRIEQAWEGRVIYLHFEGAMQVAEVWLNDRKLVTHYGGYLPFVLDISAAVKFGAENELIVRLDNRDDPQVPPGKPQRQLDFVYFGGLYRNVWMEVVSPVHISDAIVADRVGGGGVFVTFPRVDRDQARVRVQTHVCNWDQSRRAGWVRQELIDADGNVVAHVVDDFEISASGDIDMVQALELSNPKLWHPYHPHLYTLRTIILSPSPGTPGEGGGGGSLGNAKPQAAPTLTLPRSTRGGEESMEYRERGQIIDEFQTRIGIRHIQFDKDRGLLINGERFISIGANRHQDHPYVGYAMPDNQHFRDVKKLREAGFTSFRSHYPQAPAFMDACDELGMLAIVSNPGWQFVGDEIFQKRAIENARLMVRRDRNRPSVILWEGALNESENSRLAPEIQRAIHEEYPGDQCYTAGDREENFARSRSPGTPGEGKGGGASSFILHPSSFPGWDVDYLHHDGSKAYWIREWGDHVDNWSDQQSRSRVRRGWGEMPMLIQTNARLARLDQILREGQKLAGACLWAGIDCQRGYHHQPFYGGVLDPFRLPKFNYYFFQSQRPPDIHVRGLDDGAMVFIANHATFLSPTRVTVFSNCQEVRLLLDGKEIGRKRADSGHAVAHPPFTFEVECFAHEQSTMYMTGVAQVETPPTELAAEGLIAGKVVARHVVHPPGVAAKIILEADLCGRPLVADGGDWVRVHARVCDARGTTCPWADDLIEFVVEGAGAIVGDAEIGANPVCAEAGIATVLVRGKSEAEKIVVRTTAFDLAPGEITIESISA